MHPSRRTAALAAPLLTTALTLSACTGQPTGSASDRPYIAIVSKGFQQQFWQAVKKGAEQEARKRGATISFQGPATETDVEAQVTMLENSVGRKPDAIGLAALDSQAVKPMLRKAQHRHTPVIAFDSGVDSGIPATTAATDNKAAAAEAARHMAKAVGGKGKVALVVHSQTSGSGIDRRDGFTQWMKEHAPGIKLLPVQYGGGDQARSADITKAIIAANPDVKGIYGANEGSATGVIQGVRESGRKGIRTVGFDSGQGQINAIEEGDMTGAITQDPLAIGRQVVASALKAVHGRKLPKVIDTGFYWYDRRNLDDRKIQSVLYH
ncbi:ABC transporter substrate-binding protein [Streptomyces sp. ODS28]|uniref:ABC transporter substrate-binding protein n=1 Tax=Streptomyces sp. ODS28 TaxID=3136688 RepID=UPI0031EE6B74